MFTLAILDAESPFFSRSTAASQPKPSAIMKAEALLIRSSGFGL